MRSKVSKLIFMFIIPIVSCLSLGIFLAGGFVSDYASALAQTGGCFSVGNKSTINVGDGTAISVFSAVNGGGVYVTSGGTLTMSGGTIAGNTATSGNGHNVYNAGTFTMSGGTVGKSGNAKTYGIYNTGTMKLLGGTVYDDIYSSSTFTTSPSATLNGTITLSDSATISVQDYAGVTPELKIKISTSRSAGTILTFSGSSTQPDLTKITISGVDVNASNLEIVQGSSSSEWKLNFSKKTYTLSFDADGGVCSVASKTVTYGTKMTDLPTPTKEGYTFGGWYVQTGTNTTRVNLGREYMFTDKISVHFEAYSDNWADVADQIIISCTEYAGWNVEGNASSGSGYIVFPVYDKAISSYRYAVSNKKWADLTAGWHTFDLIFDGEYAMIYVDKIKLATSPKFTSTELAYNPTNSIMLGCEAGSKWGSYDWSAKSDFFVGKIANVVIQNTDELYSSDSLTTWMAPAQNVTLHAKWTPKEYVMTFDADGGTCSETSKTVTYGTKVTDLPTPTKEGYTFGGWYASFNGTSDFVSLGRDYMFTDKISVHLSAYSENWANVANQRLISCTEAGGWNIEGGSAGSDCIVFTAWDRGYGYKYAETSKTWSSLSAGWHDFDLVFDGNYLKGYVDGVLVGTSVQFASGEILYNQTNSIFVGAEPETVDAVPYNFFKGKIGNVVIQNTDELYSSDSLTTWMAPVQNLTLHAIWSLVDRELPSDWKTQVASTTYMTTTVTPSTVTSIMFERTIPSGYTQIGTLSTGLKVYQSSSDATKIAFVNSEKIYAPVDSSSLFSDLSSLTTLTFNHFDTSKVTKMAWMFQDCVNLTTLNLSNFNTSNVTNMNRMFYGCSGLKTLDLSSFNMTKVTSCTDMLNFGTSGNLRHLKTPKSNSSTLPITNGSEITLYDISTGYSVSSVPANLTSSKTYASQVTVTLNPYFGTLDSSAQTTFTCYYGIKFTDTHSESVLPTPTRSGYTFEGWYTEVSGGYKITNCVLEADAVMFIAHWEDNSGGSSGGDPGPNPEPEPDPDPGIFDGFEEGPFEVEFDGELMSGGTLNVAETIEEFFSSSTSNTFTMSDVETFSFISPANSNYFYGVQYHIVEQIGFVGSLGLYLIDEIQEGPQYGRQWNLAFISDVDIAYDPFDICDTTFLMAFPNLEIVNFSGLSTAFGALSFRIPDSVNTVIFPTGNTFSCYSMSGSPFNIYYDGDLDYSTETGSGVVVPNDFNNLSFYSIFTSLFGGVESTLPEMEGFVFMSPACPEMFEDYRVLKRVPIGNDVYFVQLQRGTDRFGIGDQNGSIYGIYGWCSINLVEFVVNNEYSLSDGSFFNIYWDCRGLIVDDMTYSVWEQFVTELIDRDELHIIIGSQWTTLYTDGQIANENYNFDGTLLASLNTFSSSSSKNGKSVEINQELQVILDDEKKRYFATKQEDLDDDSDSGEQEN